MSTGSLPTSDHVSSLNEQIIYEPENLLQRNEDSKKGNQASIGHKEHLFLVCSAVGLSVLGVIAFLISGQIAVVVAMNSPLLAIIGREFFTR